MLRYGVALPTSVLAAILTIGCSTTRIPTNYAIVAGGHVGIGSETVPSSDSVTHVIGGFAGHGDIVTRFDDGSTFRGRADAMIGGSTTYGAAGQFSVLAEGGGTLFHGEHHLFGRAGLEGTIERDPVSGLFSLEVPTVTAGYQYHGESTDGLLGSAHFELAPRASFDAVSRAFAMHDTRDVVARPEVGGTMLLMMEGIELEATYMHVFNTFPEDIVRADGCLAFLGAVCVETRQIVTAFGTDTAAVGRRAGYIGVTIGGGWITGVERHEGLF